MDLRGWYHASIHMWCYQTQDLDLRRASRPRSIATVHMACELLQEVRGGTSWRIFMGGPVPMCPSKFA